jgi:hypothetical protein
MARKQGGAATHTVFRDFVGVCAAGRGGGNWSGQAPRGMRYVSASLLTGEKASHQSAAKRVCAFETRGAVQLIHAGGFSRRPQPTTV